MKRLAVLLSATAGAVAVALGSTGPATPVTFRVTDSYDQSGTATWTPSVVAPAPPATGPLTSTGVGTGTRVVCTTGARGGGAVEAIVVPLPGSGQLERWSTSSASSVPPASPQST